MEQKHNVFFSYKSEFENVVSSLAEILERKNITCWYAPRNLDNGTAGADYDDSIVDAINATDVVVVMLCDEALRSDWVKREVTQAEEKKKMIIPFVIDALTIDNGLRMRLKDKHWIYAYPNPEKKFDILEHNIRIAIGQKDQLTTNPSSAKLEEMTFNSSIHDIDFEEGKVLYEAKEYVAAVYSLLSSADHGNPQAKNMLCSIFYNMDVEVSNIPNELWDMIQNMADKGHSFANFLMSTRYYKIPSNNLLSYDYLRKSLQMNEYPLAVLRMGIYYSWGIGTQQNLLLAHHYYQKAIEMGCTQAYSYMGQFYEYGSTKISKDLDKAEKYYIEGAEKWDIRALRLLTQLYTFPGEKENHDKAMEWAQKMIDHDIAEGYELMGSIYQVKNEWNYNTKAIQYYKQAVQRDVKNAYGDLANLYWTNGDYDNAYLYAKRGIQLNNSFCYRILSSYYEIDEKLDLAWKYMLENYNLFSSGAESLGELYLRKGYRPENFELKDLVSILEVSAKNSVEESLDYLIEIYTDPDYGMANPEKVVSWTRFGATMKYPKYLFEYGKMLLNHENVDFNAFKGLGLIEESISLGHSDAIPELADFLHQDEYEDNEMLRKLYLQGFKQHVVIKDYSKEQLSAGLEANDEQEKEWVADYIDDFVQSMTELNGDRQYAIAQILEKHFYEDVSLKEDSADNFLDAANNYIAKKNFAQPFIKLIGFLCPDIHLNEAESTGGKKGLEDYYYFFWQNKYEESLIMKRDDEIMKKIMDVFNHDSALSSLSAEQACEIFDQSKIWKLQSEYFHYYAEACKLYHLPPHPMRRLIKDEVFPFISTSCAQKLKKEYVARFLEFFQTDNPLMKKIQQIDKTSDNILEQMLDACEELESDELTLYIVNFAENILELDRIIHYNHHIVTQWLEEDNDALMETYEESLDNLKNIGLESSLSLEFLTDYLERLRVDESVESELQDDEDNDDDEDNNENENFDQQLADQLIKSLEEDK